MTNTTNSDKLFVDIEINDGNHTTTKETKAIALRSQAHLDAIQKVLWNILPVYMLIHFTNYVDRGNISFAADDIKELLDMTNSGYGQLTMYFGITYTLLQVPAQWLSKIVGARRFLSAILLVWSCAVILTGFCDQKWQFIVLRLIIGAAEAGAFPATYLHIDSFLEAKEITFSWSLIMSAAYAGTVIAGPLAAGLVYGMNGLAGLAGWRWMFVMEGIFGIIVSLVVWFSLTDSIQSLTNLNKEEKQILLEAKCLEMMPSNATSNEIETAMIEAKPKQNLTAALFDWRAWYLGIFNFCISVPIYAFTYFSPMIIKSITGGHDGKKSLDVTSFLLNAIPYFLAAVMMVGVGKSMYILKDRFYHSVIIFIAAILLGSTLTLSYNDGNGNMWGVFAQLSFYYMFVGGAYIIGDTVSASYLSQGGKAAGGYALINAIKSSSSIVSGPLIGWLSTIKGGNITQAIPTLSIFTALALVLLVLFYVIEGNFMAAIYGKAGAGGGGGADSTDNSKSDERSDSNDESSTSNNSYNIDIIRISEEE